MYGVNKVILVGTVGKDLQTQTFENGGVMSQTRLATTKRGRTLQNGTQIPDTTEWHSIVFHDGLAKVAAQWVKKGTNLYIEGELRTRKYNVQYDKVDRYATEIHVTEMHMLPSHAGASPSNTSNNPDNTGMW